MRKSLFESFFPKSSVNSIFQKCFIDFRIGSLVIAEDGFVWNLGIPFVCFCPETPKSLNKSLDSSLQLVVCQKNWPAPETLVFWLIWTDFYCSLLFRRGGRGRERGCLVNFGTVSGNVEHCHHLRAKCAILVFLVSMWSSATLSVCLCPSLLINFYCLSTHNFVLRLRFATTVQPPILSIRFQNQKTFFLLHL